MRAHRRIKGFEWLIWATVSFLFLTIYAIEHCGGGVF